MVLDRDNVEIRRRGVIVEAQRLLKSLIEFVEIDYGGGSRVIVINVTWSVNTQGKHLFQVMAEGGCADSRQSILTVEAN